MIDTHVHLDHPAFDPDREEVLARAQEAGVRALVTLGTDAASSVRAVQLAERFEVVYAAVGIHPTRAPAAKPGDREVVARLVVHPKVVGVGECGLDYERAGGAVEVQQDNLRWHAQLSRACGKPLVVHNRAAHADVLRILEEERAERVVMHMFTGPAEYAEACAARGYWISVGGPVTYARAEALRRVVARIPEDRLLVETDSPFASPHPHRGRRNEPSFLRWVVEAVALAKGQHPDAVAERTEENARRCFGLSR
ncbi:MAG: TatD family hydrolase [Armatimonadota bacterium]|nr:TatD family hydrolase [Armatimonadota bacterium]MDW8155362.1 TatD family hydrolase [Armatimonadota bacterium]